jgi:hypothetical protein
LLQILLVSLLLFEYLEEDLWELMMSSILLPHNQGSVEKANADVKEMLATWLSENNNTQWSEGFRFIQFQKNLNSRPLSLSKFIGAPNMIQISKRLYATSAAVFDFNERKLLNLVKWYW